MALSRPDYRVEMSASFGSLSRWARSCIVCCGRNRSMKINHKHLSTHHYNKWMVREGNMTPMCHFCDVAHPVDHISRQRVILTTSSLSDVQYLVGWSWHNKPPIHCDMEAIPGGKIPTLRKAWERAYMTNPLPIDTVLHAGLNDVKELAKPHLHANMPMAEVAELVSEEVLVAIRCLHRLIIEHSNKSDVNDTFAVGTLLRVPAMYWTEDYGAPPSADYVNYREVIDSTNIKIEVFNIETGATSAPKLHQAAERGRRNKRHYMFNSFREAANHEKMHLIDTEKMKMVMRYIKYFEAATPKAVKLIE